MGFLFNPYNNVNKEKSIINNGVLINGGSVKPAIINVEVIEIKLTLV